MLERFESSRINEDAREPFVLGAKHPVRFRTAVAGLQIVCAIVVLTTTTHLWLRLVMGMGAVVLLIGHILFVRDQIRDKANR